MGQRVFSLAGVILPFAALLLIILAILRVRFTAKVEEMTLRDRGQYWKTLPWSTRRGYLRRFALVSWAFSVIFILALCYGVWAAYWYHTRLA